MRLKLRISGLMTLIAISAVVFATVISLQRRALRLERIGIQYSSVASGWEDRLIGPDGTSRTSPKTDHEIAAILEQVHWNDAVAGEFYNGASRPWYPFDPDPKRITCQCSAHLSPLAKN